MNEVDYKLYDNIVASSLEEIIMKTKNDRILIKDFDSSDIYNKFVFQMGLIVSTVCNDKYVYLDMNPVKYFFYYLRHKKYKLLIKRKEELMVDDYEIDAKEFCKELCEKFNVNISIIHDIYKEYYK